MAASPTSRSLQLLRKEGWTAQVTEKWIPQTKRRLDLFGCIDIVAVKPGLILGVQATSRSNANARIKKSLAEPKLRQWLEAGGHFEVFGWSKKGPRGKAKHWRLARFAIELNSFNSELSVITREET